jgi:hypothetical protein
MAAFERTTPRLVEPDSEDNLQRQFHENGWTDGLPVVLPTEKRVAEMLGDQPQARRDRRKMQPVEFRVEEIHRRESRRERCDGWCAPEYFPVILALAASKSPARPNLELGLAMVVVNGPIRDEIKMNAGTARWGRTTTPTPPSAAPTGCSRTCREARARRHVHGRGQ